MWAKHLANAGSLFLSAIVAVIAHIGIVTDPLSRFEYLEMVAATDADTIVAVYTKRRGKTNSTPYSSEPIGGAILSTGEVRTVNIPLKNGILGYFKLKFSSGHRVIIQEIKLLSHYAPQKVIRGNELQALFVPTDEHTKVLANQGGVELRSDAEGVVVSTTGPVKAASFWLAYVLPLLLGGLAYLLTKNYRLEGIPAFHDMVQRNVGERKYRIELDGLRGLAALSVVMEHTWWRFQGVGATGVWIFFALSGFLLAQPFVSKPDRATSYVYITRYLIRRLARIVPMYYVTVLILFGLQGHVDELIDHFLFLQADGHLWTVQQEIVFYLVLPWIILALYGVSRIKPLLAAGLLATITFVSLYNPGLIPIRLFGYGIHLPFYLGLFTCGMLIAYIYATEHISLLSFSNSRFKKWISMSGLLLMGVVALLSINPVTAYFGLGTNLAKTHVMLFGLASALILFCILLSHGTLLSRFFSLKLLRSIGVVGYSYYLLHPIVAWKIIEFSKFYTGTPVAGSRLFLATAMVTWLISVFTYSLIEKPFMAAAKHYKIQAPGTT